MRQLSRSEHALQRRAESPKGWLERRERHVAPLLGPTHLFQELRLLPQAARPSRVIGRASLHGHECGGLVAALELVARELSPHVGKPGAGLEQQELRQAQLALAKLACLVSFAARLNASGRGSPHELSIATTGVGLHGHAPRKLSNRTHRLQGERRKVHVTVTSLRVRRHHHRCTHFS